jgi:hypothetical protein
MLPAVASLLSCGCVTLLYVLIAMWLVKRLQQLLHFFLVMRSSLPDTVFSFPFKIKEQQKRNKYTGNNDQHLQSDSDLTLLQISF